MCILVSRKSAEIQVTGSFFIIVLMFFAGLAFVDNTNVEAVEASNIEHSPKDTADKGKELTYCSKIWCCIRN